MPAVPPTPMAAAAASTAEPMVEVLAAATVTSPLLSSTLERAEALVLVSTTFCATAPAPLTAMPAVPPMPSDSAAAAEMALMVFLDTPSLPSAPSSSTKVSPLGAASVQALPSTRVDRRIGSTRTHLLVSA